MELQKIHKIDGARFLRSFDYNVDKGGIPGEYFVRSIVDKRVHTVRFYNANISCTCLDAAKRGNVCKHMIAVFRHTDISFETVLPQTKKKVSNVVLVVDNESERAWFEKKKKTRG